jgi:hypothetical protein
VLRKLFGIAFVGLLSALFLVPSASAFPVPVGHSIKNLRTGMCANLVAPATLDGPAGQVPCVASNQPGFFQQRWKFESGGGSTYLIRNMSDGLCLDLPFYGSVEPGTKVTGYTCQSTNDNQAFFMAKRANGYWIQHAITGLCLDVDGFGTGGEGAALTLWPCVDDDDHNWEFTPERTF